MLPCINKKYLGFECPGCGIQRSALMIFNGEFVQAFVMYPAIYTLIAMFGFILFNAFKPVRNGYKIITILAIINVILILGNFFLKLSLN